MSGDGRSLSGVLAAAFAVAVTAALLGAGLDSKAEFSDRVQLGRNELVAGVVDLSLGSSATPVVVDNLAPGDRSVLALELRNDGTLPLTVTPSVSEQAAPSAPGSVDPGPPPGVDLAVESWFAPSCDGDSASGQVGRLAPGETGNFCFSVGLPLTAPNSAQGHTTYFTIILTGVHDVTGTS